MAGFFDDIVQKFKDTGELIGATTRAGQAAAQARDVEAKLAARTATKPEIATTGFFSDIQQRFNLQSPQEFQQPKTEQPKTSVIDPTENIAPAVLKTLNLPADLAEERAAKSDIPVVKKSAPAIGFAVGLLTPFPGDEEAASERLLRGKAAAEAGTKKATEKFAAEQAAIRAENEAAGHAAAREATRPTSESLGASAKRYFFPERVQEPEVRQAYQTWNAKNAEAKAAANSEAQKLTTIPEKEGWPSIQAYEAGAESPHSAAIKETFDALHAEAKAKGFDIPYLERYVPHIYKNPETQVDEAFARFRKENPAFSRARTFPDYATAQRYGLEPKYTHPAQLAGAYRQELERTAANRDFLDSLLKAGKVLPEGAAPRTWKAVELTFSNRGYYAEPKLADFLNGIFRPQGPSPFIDRVLSAGANLSKTAQEIALSAGVPKTNINFFSMGQAIKELTSGNLKAVVPALRSNFTRKSVEFFTDKAPVIRKMAEQGIDLGGTVADFAKLYPNAVAKPSWTEMLGNGWNKLFNEKTFASFMPQLYVDTFESAYKRALKQGLAEKDAAKIAGDVTKAWHGLIRATGRSKQAEDLISTGAFAPKFREGLINFIGNTARSLTTEIGNPAFYRNRRFAVGLTLTYAAYDALNKKLSGQHLFENPAGHEFELRVPLSNGDVIYTPIAPSLLALPRNLISGTLALGHGDFRTAGQKFGSLLSMPLKITSEVLSNKDYFGREIYADNDPLSTKLRKIASYVFPTEGEGQINHPFIREMAKWLKGKKPLYQSVSEMLELPFKFSSLQGEARNAFYDAMDEQEKRRAAARTKLMPVYDHVQELIRGGKREEAQKIVDSLPDTDYETYKDISAAKKRVETRARQADVFDTVLKVRDLVKAGRRDEAKAIVDALSESEYKAFEQAKKKLQ